MISKEKRKLSSKRYRQSAKGKETQRKTQKRFYDRHRDELISTMRGYRNTPNGKLAGKRGQIYRMNRDKRMINDFKKHWCAICGYDKCNDSLHFHHTCSETKSFNLNGGAMGLSDKRIVVEFYKCILLCANCHGEIHEKERVSKVS